ncbi:hypothetical protein BN946_scf184491.g9 [Trametes cinnabarina]|uniref:Double-strand break repair protein n=1 Tax=Pycnoporus cinnabarinus TaxID=5643 RepID=A0A060T168_PYCCI|nr:hypothetical protein BN946_scf184491.g9 [Trametes cinnabarina]
MTDYSDEDREAPPVPEIRNEQADDTIKILLATDNHVGYLERDPVRGQDSINAFKEILQLAVKHDVDFVLLGGDLFHENRPSRDCLYQVMALLREYTLGDRPVQVELLSDPNDGKPPGYSFPAINYEDPNLNVAIPVFSIHGNHDDPQGAGPEGALCALDMLSVTGLVNYMGKIDLPLEDAESQNAGIAIKPVLLRKGNTRLGLYGVGNVKDQRMHFELRSNRVRMYMPRDKNDWFNILILHQNRVAHGPQQSVPEGMFDDSIDLVVWGHEHDCRIVPEPVPGKRYYITQPGSSIATSLADGESLEKHVALLKIQGKEFELTPIPLRSVRPFVIDEVVLSEAAEEEGFDLDDKIEVTKFLKNRGLLANPRDVLTFHRSKKGPARSGKVKIDEPELSIDDPTLSVSEKLSKVRVQTLVREYLAAQELQLLGEGGMSEAIEMFVEKDDIHAIQTYRHVNSALRSLMKGVQANVTEVDENEIEEIVDKVREEQERRRAEKLEEKASKGKVRKPPALSHRNELTRVRLSQGKSKASPEDSDTSVDSMLMDVDVDAGGSDFNGAMSDEPAPPRATKSRAAATKKAAPAKKAPARGKGKAAAKPISDDEDEDADEIEDEAPPPPKRTNRAAVLSQSSKKAPGRKATTAKAPASKQSQSTLSFAPAGRTSARAAASRAKRKVAETVELDSD